MRTSVSLFLLLTFSLPSTFSQTNQFREQATGIVLKLLNGEKINGILYSAKDQSITIWQTCDESIEQIERNTVEVPIQEINKIKLIHKHELEVYLFSGIALGTVVGTLNEDESGHGLFTSVSFGFLGGLAGLFIALVPNDIKPKGSSHLTPKQLRKLQKHQLLIPIQKKESEKPEPIISLSQN
ncbi:MAG: hypothetical protein AAFR87_16170 [Bacteroidota bacterium]